LPGRITARARTYFGGHISATAARTCTTVRTSVTTRRRISAIEQRLQPGPVSGVWAVRDPGLDNSPELSLSRHLYRSFQLALRHSGRCKKDLGNSVLCGRKGVIYSPLSSAKHGSSAEIGTPGLDHGLELGINRHLHNVPSRRTHSW
jgi:hypothetical protein